MTQDDYRTHAEFRYHLRRFLYASEQNARKANLSPNQFQLLLAIAGLPRFCKPTVGTLSERLMTESHSTVELLDRCEEKGLVERYREGDDKRRVYIRLTEAGHAALREVAVENRLEMRKAMPAFMKFLNSLKRPRGASKRSWQDHAFGAVSALSCCL